MAPVVPRELRCVTSIAIGSATFYAHFVTVCANCGHENPEEARFCNACATPLAAAPLAREQRKTVTVLFCDVTGSTSLGESTDPEALRALLARYFERMKGIVESHGGSVEKFIGDAVMAVFGAPQVHEDDALRAVRAAVEMRDALPELGVQARIGLNTGEVVTGTEERLATGDAVNVAARLEQAAQPGEILIGEQTLRLVREAVDAEAVEPLELKGKADAVPAHRLLEVSGELERVHEARFVGREGELDTLRQAWERARAEQRCQLFTITGDPGVGKSRLVAEFLAANEARVVQGRCLSYGEGITYWPVVEVLKQLDALPTDPDAAAPLRSLLGETHEARSADEIAWAFRKLLEEQAPLVCLFDDIQWGEETFLDLLEHVALLSSGAPLLILCLARPELAERRPQWPLALRLEPLPSTEVEALFPATVPDELREKIARAAGGNPLFVTEMVAMAREAGGEVTVPPNLRALLAARLDQLEQPERWVLERGAVEGELFHRTAVQALSGDGEVTPRLASLVRKELLRPDKPQLPGDDAFRFRHLLIRDAAYDALPKATRAELHERFAAWLEQRAADLVELDEILGYHLEQAARYKAELGQPDAALAERAGERLAAAGRRAIWRGDRRAARPLIERALELIRPLRLDVHLELDAVDEESTPEEGAANAERVALQAREAGDQAGEALALAVGAFSRSLLGLETAEEVERCAHEALPLLEASEDHAALGRLWHILGHGVANTLGHFHEWARAAEESLRHYKLAGHDYPLGKSGLTAALVFGPRPADEALETLDSVLPANPDAWVQLRRSTLLAMLARFDEAWAIALAARERRREVGTDDDGWLQLADIAVLAGDHENAVGYLRHGCDLLERRGAWAHLSTLAPQLGRSLHALGHNEEAEHLARRGRELGSEDDLLTQTLWRQVQALVQAHRGSEHEEAERLAREAVSITERMDGLNLQGDAYCDLAAVLAAAGRTNEAAEALEQALDRYERKKNLAMVAQVKPKLEELRAQVS
jgi:class 3 adenylate cyclase/tetratricopeptide (TPR) repeat protein